MKARRFGQVLAFVLPVCLLAFAAAGDAQKGYPVVRTIDGDTIVVRMDGKETKVRLIGVDTPETVDPRKPVQAFGKEASDFTKKLLTGESVLLEYGQERTDKYGRTLAYVYRAKDKLFVNLEIVKQGYGHAYPKYPFAQEKMDAFRTAEKEAREAKRGLWGDAPAQAKEKPATGKEIVYVTSSGKKYHIEGYRHLAKSMAAISLEDAKKRGLEPCKVCNPPK